LAEFAKAGIDAEELAARLQQEGAESFARSWKDLIDCIASKSTTVSKAG
jgi:transaldolase